MTEDRRSIALEKLAKEMLRSLDKSDDVKVGITEVQERLDMSEKSVFLFCSASGPAGDERKWPFFRNFQAWRRIVVCCQLGRTSERSGGVGKKVSKHEAGDTSIE